MKLKADWHACDLYCYDDDFTFRLVSVHDHVVNLQVESWPHLLIVGDLTLEQGPAAIGMAYDDFSLFKSIVTEEIYGTFSQKCLEIRNQNKVCSLSWRDGRAISFAPQRYNNLESCAVKRAVTEYRKLILKKPLPTAAAVLFDLPGGDSYFRQNIINFYPELVDAILQKRKHDLLQHCRKLAGMGKGLTPTGDDLIHGALLAFHYFIYDDIFLKQLADNFRAVYRNNTNLFGAHMLELGLAGLTPLIVIAFLNSIAEGSPDPLIYKRLIEIGSCTGHDIAIALLYFAEKIYV